MLATESVETCRVDKGPIVGMGTTGLRWGAPVEAGSDGQALDPHRCGDGPRPGTRPCPQKHCGCSHPSQSLHLPIPCPLGSEHRRWLIHASARPKAAGLRPRRLSTWHSFSKDRKPQTRCFLNQRTGVSLGRGKDGASRVPRAPKQWAWEGGQPPEALPGAPGPTPRKHCRPPPCFRTAPAPTPAEAQPGPRAGSRRPQGERPPLRGQPPHAGTSRSEVAECVSGVPTA